MSQVIKFEKIVPEGKAMGHLPDGRALFCIGPIPGEVAEVGIRKQKKTYAEAELRKIITPSPARTTEVSDHTMSTAPWQGIDYTLQLKLKKAMLVEAYGQNHLSVEQPEIVASKETIGYRNRLDFTLAEIDGKTSLAFHQRGAWDKLIAIDGSNLGSESMNQAARDLVSQLSELNNPVTPGMVTIRHTRSTGQLLTVLTTSARANWKRINSKTLGNFLVAKPLKGSGAPGHITYQDGDSYITETIHGVNITYPYNSFFQTNTATFELALKKIISAAKNYSHIVELYSGVGAIGLPLAASGALVKGVEISPEAVEFAERNARANSIHSYSAEAVAAEKMDSSVLEGADCVILDPPRAGLHPRVTKWLKESHPQTIIYLSCNPITQARDIAALSASYSLQSIEGFDFYPGTLHLESLAILKRK